MADCPKCRGVMTPGHIYLPDTGGRVKWLDGEPGFWKTVMGFQRKSSELASRRCSECGFVEFFADASVKPVKTLATIEGGNNFQDRYSPALGVSVSRTAGTVLGLPSGETLNIALDSFRVKFADGTTWNLASHGTALLRARGFEEVYHLQGGILKYLEVA